MDLLNTSVINLKTGHSNCWSTVLWNPPSLTCFACLHQPFNMDHGTHPAPYTTGDARLFQRGRHDKDSLSLNLTIHLHGTVHHMITRWTYLSQIYLLSNRQHWKLKGHRGIKVSASCNNKPAIPHAVQYPLKFNTVLFPVWNYSCRNKNWTV
jgi:hypothetical protein